MTKLEFLDFIGDVDDNTELRFFNLDSEEGEEIMDIFSKEIVVNNEEEIFINITKETENS